MASLIGKVAVIVGGARGIGAAISRRMVTDGAAVAIVYLSRSDEAETLASELRAAGGTVLLVQANASDPAALNEAIDASFAAFGRLDILVSVAGMAIVGLSMPMPTTHSIARSRSMSAPPLSLPGKQRR